jgi:hypothetical protein
MELLQEPRFNKSTAFAAAEREAPEASFGISACCFSAPARPAPALRA